MLGGYLKLLPMFFIVMPGMISRALFPGQSVLYYRILIQHTTCQIQPISPCCPKNRTGITSSSDVLICMDESESLWAG